MSTWQSLPYQYLVVRCVPRVDREEFVNVGVVLYCQRAEFLSCATHLDAQRLLCIAPGLDLGAVAEALAAIEAECRGDASAGLAGREGLGLRFGHIAAPRSTVVQPGPVHGGRTTPACPDPADVLEHLLATLVKAPDAAPEARDTRE
jgi:hypothetical protein